MDRRALLQCLPTIALIPAAVWTGAEPNFVFTMRTRANWTIC